MSTVYFAWADSTETAFHIQHHVVDENIFNLELSQSEGEFGEAIVDVKNPMVGLLNINRKQWAWLSYDDGSTVTPLLFGRLVGVPEEMAGSIARLRFIAKPLDYDAKLEAVAAPLRVLPFFDPMFVSPEEREDPARVLDARSELWDCDRVSHVITTTDVNVGETSLDLAGNYFYDGLSVTPSGEPARRINVQAGARWRQQGRGEIDITSKLQGGRIDCYTFSSLIDDWPEVGARIGRDWEITKTSARLAGATPFLEGGNYWRGVFTLGLRDSARAQAGIVACQMSTSWTLERDYEELLTFSLVADTQPIFSEPGETDTIDLEIFGDADQPADNGNTETPISDLRSRRYFATTRGKQSVEHVLLLARAQLRASARVVEVRFDMPFEAGLNLSNKMSVTIADARLPGGAATGKLKNYVLSINGDTGEAKTTLLLGCTIGRDGSVSSAAGAPSYADAGYVDNGYQFNSGEFSDVAALSELAYADFSDVSPNDDGIELDQINANNGVESFQVINTAGQLIEINTPVNFFSLNSISVLNDYATLCRLKMHEFEPGPFETMIPLEVTELKIPKTIDLEAS